MGKRCALRLHPSPDPQLALVSDLINKIEDASARVQKKVEQIYRKRIDDDDEDELEFDDPLCACDTCCCACAYSCGDAVHP